MISSHDLSRASGWSMKEEMLDAIRSVGQRQEGNPHLNISPQRSCEALNTCRHTLSIKACS